MNKLSIFALVLSAFCARADTFTATGTLLITDYSNEVVMPDPLSRNFTVQVDDAKWFIRIETDGVADRAGIGVFEESCDGENLYEQIQYKIPAENPDGAQSGKSEKGFEPPKAFAKIKKQTLPVVFSGTGDAAVWLAYAAKGGLHQDKRGRLPVLWEDALLVENQVELPVLTSFWSNGFAKEIKWENDGMLRFSKENKKLGMKPYPSPYDKGYLNASFDSSLTNIGPLVLPANFVLTTYIIRWPPGPTNEVLRRSEVRGHLIAASPEAPEAGVPLRTIGRTAVEDYRFSERNSSALLHYIVSNANTSITPLTNSELLSAAAKNLESWAHKHQMDVRNDQRQNETTRYFFIVILACLVLVPTLFLLKRGSLRSVKNNKQT